jgi:hypothetical protein
MDSVYNIKVRRIKNRRGKSYGWGSRSFVLSGPGYYEECMPKVSSNQYHPRKEFSGMFSDCCPSFGILELTRLHEKAYDLSVAYDAGKRARQELAHDSLLGKAFSRSDLTTWQYDFLTGLNSQLRDGHSLSDRQAEVLGWISSGWRSSDKEQE